MKTLRIGSRRSALAQAQANWVTHRLHQTAPQLTSELIWITTAGDQPTSRAPEPPLGGLKALFTKELEDALLQGKIDIAVHSLKDMPVELPTGLIIGAIPEREDTRDAWISARGIPFGQLPTGARVGTGAARRIAQLKRARPDLTIVPIRGNVDTRLRKLKEEQLDGLILAVAGLKRLGRERDVTEILPIDFLLPAVGQGSLAIEVRHKDSDILSCVKTLDHMSSHQTATAERAFLEGLGGSCQTPIAGLAYLEGGNLVMKGLVLSPDGRETCSASEVGRPFDAAGVGQRLAAKLREAGADRLLRGQKG